jgi:hypothetical protein
MVLVDADVIVTRSFMPLVAQARAGGIVAFVDRVSHRFDPRWSELLGLGQLRRQPYVNAGVVVTNRLWGTALCTQVRDLHDRIDVERSYVAGGSPEDPFYYLDQDVVNAVLSTYPQEYLEFLEHRLVPVPPFPGLAVVDEAALRCSYPDGTDTFALHHVLQKPWLGRTRSNAYSRLLRRLLLRRDVAVAVEEHELPLRLRTGALAALERRRSDGTATLLSMRGRLGIRRRLLRKRG